MQYVPNFKKNLLSVGECTKKGHNINFLDDKVEILHEKKIIVHGIKQDNNIYKLYPTMKTEANLGITRSKRLWHARLGHINEKALMETKKKELAKGLDFVDEEKSFCEDCQFGKSHRLPFKKFEPIRSNAPGELIYSDVCGPINVTSLGGVRDFFFLKTTVQVFCSIFSEA